MNNIPKNNTHYFKYDISDNLSLRYFIQFQDNKTLEGKWVIKSHSSKEYSILRHSLANELLQTLQSSKKEIIGRLINGTYEKIIINDSSISIINEKENTQKEVKTGILRDTVIQSDFNLCKDVMSYAEERQWEEKEMK